MGKKSRVKNNFRNNKSKAPWETEEVESISPKTEEQKQLLSAIHSNDITIAVGPAGTGKSLLSCYAAVQMLEKGKVNRIVLTRPVVEAGERLGYLPGTFQEKLDPYLQPLWQCMNELAGPDALETWKNTEVVKVMPLAYLRGVTFKNSFVILDESQNTTVEQMKMFLTRLGSGSKMVVNGDVTQIDLPPRTLSGLVHAREVFHDVPNIAIVELTTQSILRHPTVQGVIEAYTKHEENKTKRLRC